MSASQLKSFPCPKCGTGRGELEGVCPNCLWGPNVPAAVVDASLYSQPLAKPAGHLWIGSITIVFGGGLLLGGLIFLVMSSFVFSGSDAGAALVICPIVQMLLGIVVIVSGILFLRRQIFAKWLLLIAIAGVLANTAYLVIAARSFFAG